MFGNCFSNRVVGLAIAFAGILKSSATVAQITPDATLPVNSIVIPNGNTFTIEGGTATGSNWFHSFDRFNLPAGSTVLFDNAATIQNIFSRVTGNSISNIDGLIRANGTANLFILNPNGILFGTNAQLDLGGSFFASTADRIIFADGGQFNAGGAHTGSAGERPNAPLLSMTVPIGLQFNRGNAGTIQANGSQLSVPRGQTLALIGGEIQIPGGNRRTDAIAQLSAPGGKIDLIALQEGEWGLDGTLRQSPAISERQPAIDTTGALLTTFDLGNGGPIRLWAIGDITTGEIETTGTIGTHRGGDIDLSSAAGSIAILGKITANGAGQAGNIRLQAAENLSLNARIVSGGAMGGTFEFTSRQLLSSGPGTFVASLSNGAGRGGDITLRARSMRLQGFLGAQTFGAGRGGDILANATDTVAILEGGGGLSTTAFGTGDAGNIILNTRQLIIENSTSQLIGISTTADPKSRGNGGDIEIYASESITIAGNRPGVFVPKLEPLAVLANPANTGIATVSLGAGDAGDLTIETGRLTLRNGAGASTAAIGPTGNGGTLRVRATEIRSQGFGGLSTNTFGAGRSGDLLIDTEQMVLTEGAVMLVDSFGTGDAGNLTLNADRLTVQGYSLLGASTGASGRGGMLQINATESIEVVGTGDLAVANGLLARSLGSGEAGNVRIDTPRLSVRDGGTISVSGSSLGAAGNLDITADRLILDRGQLTAETAAGDRANIRLQVPDLQLRRGSQIATNATGTATGGNIHIETQTLAALENSDITANARQGLGGRVSVLADGLLGTAFRSQLTPESDITATSELGRRFSGVVDIQTPHTSPHLGLLELTDSTVNSVALIALGCTLDRGNSFAISERGVQLDDSGAAQHRTSTWVDFRDWRQVGNAEVNEAGGLSEGGFPAISLTQATGWVRHADGRVELVAAATGEPQPRSCSR